MDRRLVYIFRPDTELAIEILSDSFFDYSVLRQVLGTDSGAYAEGVRLLSEMWVEARLGRNDPMFVVMEGDVAVGIAMITLPGPDSPGPVFDAMKASMWEQLGSPARARYEAFSAAARSTEIGAPHHHLDMLGVRRTHQRMGIGRTLLDEVHRISREDPESTGVGLTTENPANIEIYQHVGYSVVGSAAITDTFHTWRLFRPD